MIKSIRNVIAEVRNAKLAVQGKDLGRVEVRRGPDGVCMNFLAF